MDRLGMWDIPKGDPNFEVNGPSLLILIRSAFRPIWEHPVSTVVLGGLERQSIPGGSLPASCQLPCQAHAWLCLRLDSILSAALTLSLSFCQQGRHWECPQLQFSSVQFSRSVVSDSLRPHGLQHTRPPCPSPAPRVYPNLCPLSRWCHPAISSSAVPFSFCLQSFPASGSIQISQLFTSGGQRIGVSASTSVPSMNTQDWSPLGWTGWISLQSKGFSRVFSNITVQKHQFFSTQLSL